MQNKLEKNKFKKLKMNLINRTKHGIVFNDGLNL